MSVYAYDKSIVKAFECIFNKDISINVVENLFDFKAFIHRDDLQLPIINITRTGWSINDNRNHAMKFTGSFVDKYLKEDEQMIYYKGVRMMPININYQVDVFTDTRKENDLIMRELIFYLSTHPTLLVNIPYGLDIQHVFNLIFDSNVEDNSDIAGHSNKGRYFRQTIGMYIDNAYLWKSYDEAQYELGLSFEMYSPEIEDEDLIEKEHIDLPTNKEGE